MPALETNQQREKRRIRNKKKRSLFAKRLFNNRKGGEQRNQLVQKIHSEHYQRVERMTDEDRGVPVQRRSEYEIAQIQDGDAPKKNLYKVYAGGWLRAETTDVEKAKETKQQYIDEGYKPVNIKIELI